MTRPDADTRFLVTTAPGLEGLLLEELSALGLSAAATAAGPVAVEGSWDVAARIAVESRIASRLLLPLRSFAARHRAMLYDQARRVDWHEILPRGATIAIQSVGNAQGTDFTLAYSALRLKDAVCDTFRAHGLPRPDVDRHRPDARIVAFFNAGRCELSLDLIGEPLHRRGYREEGARAPLRENRAAALLRFAEFDGSRPLVDPFCGSGTIAVEAALIAGGRAPGLLRPLTVIAAVRLFPESRAVFETARERARKRAGSPPAHEIRGVDLDPAALRAAARNAERAGVASWIRFEKGDALALSSPPAFLVSNPPYGERLETKESAATLLREFVHRVKHHAVGSRLALVLPRGALEKSVGLKPDRKLDVESGDLRLRFLRYELYAGSRGKDAGRDRSA